MSGPAPTYFERLIRRLQHMPLWQKSLITLVLLGLPYGLTVLEGVQADYLNRETWRTAYFPTVTILYILAVAPWIWRVEQKVREGLRPLICTEHASRDMAIYRRWWRSKQGNWIAFGVGLVVGVLLSISSSLPDLHYWAVRYWLGTMLVLYGVLVWFIYATLGSARLTALLHRHVLHQDPFDLTPFEPVGRQGLILAMIFIGAITLSLFFVYSPTTFLDWRGIAVYSILVLVTVLIFFTVMWPAHRVLQRGKEQRLENVRRLIGQTYRKLETLAADQGDTQPVAAEVLAWLTLEQRLKQTRTWPYDTEMLRTLSISVLTPLFVATARVVGTYLAVGHF